MSQERVTFVDGASIACWRSGEGSPLVLVHGTSTVAILDFGPRHLLDESPVQKPFLVPMSCAQTHDDTSGTGGERHILGKGW
jgi:hypothetical protein